MERLAAIALALALGACTGTSDVTPPASGGATPTTAEPPRATSESGATASPSSAASASAVASPSPATSSPARTPDTSTTPTAASVPPASAYEFEEFDVTPGSHPHDVAPAPDGSVWYTAQ